MIADICGKPIVVNECEQGGVLGCCVVGAAISAFDGNYKNAADALVHKSDTYFPNMDLHKLYAPIFDKYKALYEANKNLGKM